MDLTPYVDRLREQLLAASAGAGAETEEAARRLTLALDPSVRLALMEALSHAAAEITTELPSGSLTVRLDGRELDFVLELPAAPAPPQPPEHPPAHAPDEVQGDDGGVVRMTLRLPEALKTRAEERAASAGQSLNTWLVDAVRDATTDRAVRVDVDLGALPFVRGRDGGARHHLRGWV